MKRRTFIQTLAAAVAFITSPLRSQSAPLPAPTPAPTATGLGQAASAIYVYNPAIDLDGIADLTFGQIKVFKGGEITRIVSGEQRIGQFTHERPERCRIEETKHTRSYVNSDDKKTYLYSWTEMAWFLSYPAMEILQSLHCQRDILSRSLIHIPEWDNKPVDLKSVNALIAGATIAERQRAIAALPRASWRMTSVLRQNLPKALFGFRAEAERVIATTMLNVEQGTVQYIDRYVREIARVADLPLPKLRQYEPTLLTEDEILSIKQQAHEAAKRSRTYVVQGGKVLEKPGLKLAKTNLIKSRTEVPWTRGPFVSRGESKARIREAARRILNGDVV